jgi:hypothetical protein
MRGSSGKIEQVPTQTVSARWVMEQPEFNMGVADARAGRPNRAAYDTWDDVDQQWNYERDRVWARLTPRHVPLKIKGRISPQALQWFMRHDADIL